MAYCKNCGVELEQNTMFCPLCGNEVGNSIDITKKVNEKPEQLSQADNFQNNKLNKWERIKLLWEISTIILFFSILITAIIDFIMNKNITWSSYPVLSCISIFAYITQIVFLRKIRIIQFFFSIIIISGYLLSISLIQGNYNWAVFIAIPIVFSVHIIGLLLIFTINKCKNAGFNILAYSFLSIGIFIILLELIISLYYHMFPLLGWSIIAFVSILPVVALLLFFHFRLKKGTSLKKFFHI